MKLSPSSINLFKNNPALWVLKEYYQIRTPSGDPAMRGKLVEDGLNAFLQGTPYEECVDLAHDYWEDPEQRLEITNYLDTALLAIQEFCDSEPEQQLHIECEIEGVYVHGYLDYSFEDKCVDLKTTNKLPKLLTSNAKLGQLPAAKMDNIRQQAIYNIATGKPQYLAYVSPDDYYIHEVQEAEYQRGLESVKELATKMKELNSMTEEQRLVWTAPFVEKLYNHFFVPADIYHKATEIWHGHI